MNRKLLLAVAVLLWAGNVAMAEGVKLEPSDRLKRVAEAAVRAVQKDAAKPLKDDQIAVTVVDLRDPGKVEVGDFRGEEKIYPASVVKLFYLAAAHAWMEEGKLKDTPELRRGLKDMIVDSSNDATHYVLEALTDAPGGAELEPEAFKAWAEKRNAVNRYFEGLGYVGVNACQKPYAEGPYGLDRQFLGAKFENRNKLTTNATARLMSEIVLGKAVSAERSRQMLELLKRDFSAAKTGSDEDQAHDFTGPALKGGDRLWSKAGWTSTARHDAAYVESGDVRAVIVTFTTGHANEKGIVPGVAGYVLKELGGTEK